MRKTFIYALRDPETNEIRYIGKSNDPDARLSNHLALTDVDTNKHKKRWLRNLQRKGLRPEIEILEEVKYSLWEEREKHWIAEGKQRGWPLTNISLGGSGYMEKDPDKELLEALSLYLRPEEMPHLEHESLEWLATVALDMARAAIPYSKGMFSGKCLTPGKGYEEARRVLYDALGLQSLHG